MGGAVCGALLSGKPLYDFVSVLRIEAGCCEGEHTATYLLTKSTRGARMRVEKPANFHLCFCPLKKIKVRTPKKATSV